MPFNYEMNRHRRTAQSLLFGLIISDRRWVDDNRRSSWKFKMSPQSGIREKEQFGCAEVIMK